MERHVNRVRHIGVEHDLQQGHASPDLRKDYYSRLNTLQIRQEKGLLFKKHEVRNIEGFLNKHVKRSMLGGQAYIDLGKARKEIKILSRDLQLSRAERRALSKALEQKKKQLMQYGAKLSFTGRKLFISQKQANYIFEAAMRQDRGAKYAYSQSKRQLSKLEAFSNQSFGKVAARAKEVGKQAYIHIDQSQLNKEQIDTLNQLSVLPSSNVMKVKHGFELKRSFIESVSRSRERDFVRQQVKVLHYPAAVEQADIRLAQIIARGEKGHRRMIEVQASNASEKRYLSRLSNLSDFVTRGRGLDGFRINVDEAVHAIHLRRDIVGAMVQEIQLFPCEKLKQHFKYEGEHLESGGWRINPDQIKDKKYLDATIYRLHQAATFYPEYIKQESSGAYILSKAGAEEVGLLNSQDRNQLSPAKRHVVGTFSWAQEAQEHFRGVSENLNLEALDIANTKRGGKCPIKAKPAASTEAKYNSIAKRISSIPLEGRAAYLCDRANEVSRSTWWRERAVVIRSLLAAEKLTSGNQRKKINALRSGIEKMQYSQLRSVQYKTKFPAYRNAFKQESYGALKEELKARQDMELHDVLVLSRVLGLRPAEIGKGVSLKLQSDGAIAVSINTAKKSSGAAYGDARFKAAKGRDRTIVIQSDELSELHNRVGNHFQPTSSMSALQMRLRRVRENVSGAENMTFYSFRHHIRTELSKAEKGRNEIAHFMGHHSLASQEAYGEV